MGKHVLNVHLVHGQGVDLKLLHKSSRLVGGCGEGIQNQP